MALSATARRALDAYGGADRWRAASRVRLVLSAHGLAFRLKWQPPLSRVRQVLEIREPRVRCEGIDRAGHVGVLDGHDVRLETPDGAPVAARPGARAFFGPGRRWFYWDSLDQAYFACYAAWNYFTLPALLLRDDVSWTEVEAGVLEGRFPPALPTHCALQRFTFSTASGLLLRHDYAPDIISPLARASRIVVAHGSHDGVPFPRLMRITPRAAGAVLPGPLLVSVEAHAFEME